MLYYHYFKTDIKYILYPEATSHFKDLKALASTLNIAIRTLRKIASGHRTTSKVAQCISEALNVKLEAQGHNIAAISTRLGHSRKSTTMDIYVHSLKGSDSAASDLLEKTLFEIKSTGEAK